MRMKVVNALKSSESNQPAFLPEPQNDILVLGIGNLLMKDEGVGIHVARRLEKENLPGTDLMDGGTGGLHLLDHIQRHKKVIIIDASLDEYPAGTVRVLHPKFTRDFPRQLSAHEIGFKDLIDAAVITGNLPEMHLVAISVKDFNEMGMELSAEAEAAIPEAMARVLELVLTRGPTG